jgi:DNA-directed RNA polymerase subunit RPC12/RpoP
MTKSTTKNPACLYCRSICETASLKCRNCGAPIVSEEAATFDWRSCPYCRRKLLALASPTCNYCGLKLPEHFTEKREEHLRRISQLNDAGRKAETKDKIDEVLRIAESHDRKGNVSLLDLVNWVDLTDLFS